MLRYRIYQVVTHPSFPTYAFRLSLLGYILAFFLILNPQHLQIDAFVSENALTPQQQTTTISYSDLNPWLQIPNPESFLKNSIKAKKSQSSQVHTLIIRASRAVKSQCIAFAVSYKHAESLNLFRDYSRFLSQNKQWLGMNVLFIFYSDIKDLQIWIEKYGKTPEYFGIIRVVIGLEFDQRFGAFSLQGDGFNGVQTDVDIVVSMKKLFKKSELILKHPQQIQGYFIEGTLGSWQSILKGTPDLPHSYFLNKGVLSVSLKSIKTQKNLQLQDLQIPILKLLQTMTRTFTALDENLHAGYYFYYFPSSTKMVPLGRYAFILAALIAPLVLEAIVILKQEWRDLNAGILTLFPYAVILIVQLVLGINQQSLFVLGFLGTIPNFMKVEINYEVLKAYSNLTLGLSLGLLGVRMFPLAVMYSFLVPFKIGVNRNSIRKYLFVFDVIISVCLVLWLYETHQMNGMYDLWIICPSLWSITYYL